MTIENQHIGSPFSDWLAEQGWDEDDYNYATKRVLAWQIEQGMKGQGISKSEMARRMGTSRAHPDRLLNLRNDQVQLDTVQHRLLARNYASRRHDDNRRNAERFRLMRMSETCR